MLVGLLKLIWPAGRTDLKLRVLAALGLLVGSKVLNVQVPFFFKYAVDILNDPVATMASLPVGFALLTSAGAMLIGYGIARTGASMFNELRSAVFAKVSQAGIRHIAKRTFLQLHGLDLNYHLSRQTGALSRAIDRGSRGINFILNSLVFNVLPIILEVSMVAGLLAYNCGPAFAAVTVASIGAYTAFTVGVTQWRTRFRKEMNQAENEGGAKAIDSLLNFETVKYFGNETHEAERYDKALKKYEHASLKTATSLALLNFGQNAVLSMGLTAVMLMSAHQIQTGAVSVGDLVMVNGLLFQLAMPLNFLGTVYREVKQSLIDLNTLFDILALKPKISNSPKAKPLMLPDYILKKAPAIHVSGEAPAVEFENVAFGYDQRSPIFKDVSLRIPFGHKAALVGPSGSGKSTVLRLMYRFYEPTDGVIRINGQDVRDVTLESLRKAIGVVPQDCVLFNDTIRYNIGYGNLNADQAMVEEAARAADIHNIIQRMPHGYDTQVGERGLKLSGGEKQRVAIARTVLKDAPILLYDEATSSLDAITEANILGAVESLASDRTMLAVAHRLSTIVHSDIIFVLIDGRVAESGSHEELLKDSNSYYAYMWHNQQKTPARRSSQNSSSATTIITE
ncbi:uncharacterized protein MONBRDRAFT_20835 [Monosiga brevicollis MX1]|uniref:Uncharacterized protein n=1 Tax=Monosiga brevicollis TaxID=81824 RepID=A9UY17_MONBE|nr:uncharacterized protein MONBRDRAFT_20835 [Monosiga brevicollis MX1]EDQ89783.1 predicted protein [Monosiga brevicollis MX1]|eukprot:XP_001745205.1 hypothetical protein [Monosiga brevicollis MX1]